MSEADGKDEISPERVLERDREERTIDQFLGKGGQERVKEEDDRPEAGPGVRKGEEGIRCELCREECKRNRTGEKAEDNMSQVGPGGSGRIKRVVVEARILDQHPRAVSGYNDECRNNPSDGLDAGKVKADRDQNEKGNEFEETENTIRGH